MQATNVPWHVAALNLPVGDFPGGPVAKTLCSQCKGLRFKPWSGSWIPCVATKTQHSQINNNHKNNNKK